MATLLVGTVFRICIIQNLHCSSGIYIMTASDSYRNENIHDMRCRYEAVSDLGFTKHAN